MDKKTDEEILEIIERNNIKVFLDHLDSTLPMEEQMPMLEAKPEVWRQFIRLARLGLWAEEHMPVIKEGLEAGDRFYYGAPKYHKALEAIPEVKL